MGMYIMFALMGWMLWAGFQPDPEWEAENKEIERQRMARDSHYHTHVPGTPWTRAQKYAVFGQTYETGRYRRKG